MGDISEMILEGILCSVCGEFMGDECGYPRECAGCSGQDGEEEEE